MAGIGSVNAALQADILPIEDVAQLALKLTVQRKKPSQATNVSCHIPPVSSRSDQKDLMTEAHNHWFGSLISGTLHMLMRKYNISRSFGGVVVVLCKIDLSSTLRRFGQKALCISGNDSQCEFQHFFLTAKYLGIVRCRLLKLSADDFGPVLFCETGYGLTHSHNSPLTY